MYNVITTKGKLVLQQAPAAATTTVNGTGIDISRSDSVTFVVMFGAISGTSPTYDFKVQESDDNSTWTDIAGAAHTTKNASAASSVLPGLTVRTAKRYVRSVETIGGTTPSFTRAVLAIGNSDVVPANTGEIFVESAGAV